MSEPKKALKAGIAGDEGADVPVVAVERAQRLLVVGIGQEAHVEYEIGFTRQAASVGERDQRQRQCGTAFEAEMPGQKSAQLGRRELGGIDRGVGMIA